MKRTLYTDSLGLSPAKKGKGYLKFFIDCDTCAQDLANMV